MTASPPAGMPLAFVVVAASVFTYVLGQYDHAPDAGNSIARPQTPSTDWIGSAPDSVPLCVHTPLAAVTPAVPESTSRPSASEASNEKCATSPRCVDGRRASSAPAFT